MPKFLIDIRDYTYTRIGVVESYTSFEAVIRYSDVGSWTLTLPGNAPECALLTTGGGIIVRLAGQPTPLFSGPITKIERKWNAANPGLGETTYSGVTDENLIFQRVTYPLPTAPLVPAQQVDDYRTAGAAGVVLADLVNKNCGPGALAARRFNQLDIPVSALGPQVTVNTRFDVLGDRVKEIAAGAGIGWRLRQGLGLRLAFETFIPQKKTNIIFGARFGNMVEYTYSLEAPQADRVIIGAIGDLRHRYVEQSIYDPYVVERINDNDPRIAYVLGSTYVSGSVQGEFNNDYTYQTSPANGKRTELTFVGTGVRWFTRGINATTFTPTIDGVAQSNVSITANGAVRVKGFEVLNLPYGEHTVYITPVVGDLQTDFFEVLDSGLNHVPYDWRMNAERFLDRTDIPVTYNNIYEAANPTSFAPANPADYRPQIDQAITEAWAEHAPKASLSITPLDTAEVVFGRDYTLGDRVSVEIDGSVITDVLREVRLTDGSDGPRVSPVVGDSSATSTPAIYRQLRRVFSSLRKLEGRR